MFFAGLVAVYQLGTIFTLINKRVNTDQPGRGSLGSGLSHNSVRSLLGLVDLRQDFENTESA
jgi:hypothetical protein